MSGKVMEITRESRLALLDAAQPHLTKGHWDLLLLINSTLEADAADLEKARLTIANLERLRARDLLRIERLVRAVENAVTEARIEQQFMVAVKEGTVVGG